MARLVPCPSCKRHTAHDADVDVDRSVPFYGCPDVSCGGDNVKDAGRDSAGDASDAGDAGSDAEPPDGGPDAS